MLARSVAGRAQLGPRPLDPGPGTELLECAQRGVKRLSRLDEPSSPPQALTVDELGASALECSRRPLVELERPAEAAVQFVVEDEQAAAAGARRKRPAVLVVSGPTLERRESSLGGVHAALANVGLDQVGVERNRGRGRAP